VKDVPGHDYTTNHQLTPYLPEPLSPPRLGDIEGEQLPSITIQTTWCLRWRADGAATMRHLRAMARGVAGEQTASGRSNAVCMVTALQRLATATTTSATTFSCACAGRTSGHLYHYTPHTSHPFPIAYPPPPHTWPTRSPSQEDHCTSAFCPLCTQTHTSHASLPSAPSPHTPAHTRPCHASHPSHAPFTHTPTHTTTIRR